MIPFDDRDGLIWLDGQLVPWRQAKLHVLTHGLHYGSGVFEGERVYDGHVFREHDHAIRLQKSAEILDFQIPFSLEQMAQGVQELIQQNNIPNGYLRRLAWRGSEMIGVSAQNTRIHLAMAVWEWPSYFPPELLQQGIRLTTSDWVCPPPNAMPIASKAVGNYMIRTLSKHKAERLGYTDALLLDWRGYLAEATGANLFLLMDGALHTPTPDCFLNGITRQTVMALARRRGIEVVERHIAPSELAKAAEVFLTGTAAEVTPVGRIDDHSFAVGAVTRQLMADYQALVRGGDDALVI
ncbi:MAG: branched-chain amino acid aminotransferase [Alphaproteobacteria bacterium]|nr:branched-chain amino acid aminotransferase [Alphaproteobacteria bacterium]